MRDRQTGRRGVKEKDKKCCCRKNEPVPSKQKYTDNKARSDEKGPTTVARNSQDIEGRGRDERRICKRPCVYA